MALMHLDVTNGMGSIPAGSPTQIGRVRKSSEVTLTNFRPLVATGPCGSCMPVKQFAAVVVWAGACRLRCENRAPPQHVRGIPRGVSCAVYRALVPLLSHRHHVHR